MKLKNIIIAGVTGIAMLAAVLVSSVPAKAAVIGSNDSLGNLVVLNELFDGNDSSGILSNSNGIDLGNLFVLDQLFNSSSSNLFKAKSSSSKSSLGDLIILNQIFGGGMLNGDGVAGGSNNLGRLFVLDRLFAR